MDRHLSDAQLECWRKKPRVCRDFRRLDSSWHYHHDQAMTNYCQSGWACWEMVDDLARGICRSSPKKLPRIQVRRPSPALRRRLSSIPQSRSERHPRSPRSALDFARMAHDPGRICRPWFPPPSSQFYLRRRRVMEQRHDRNCRKKRSRSSIPAKWARRWLPCWPVAALASSPR